MMGDMPGYMHEVGMMDMPPDVMPPMEGHMGQHGPSYVPPPPYPIPGENHAMPDVCKSALDEVEGDICTKIIMIRILTIDGEEVSDGIMEWDRMICHRNDNAHRHEVCKVLRFFHLWICHIECVHTQMALFALGVIRVVTVGGFGGVCWSSLQDIRHVFLIS